MPDSLIQIALALGIGLLIGLQRERADASMGGVRTFPLVALAGVLAGQLGVAVDSGWIVAAGALGLVALLIGSNLAERDLGHPRPGRTTEMAALVVYLIGAVFAHGWLKEGIVCSGLVAVLLQYKGPLHRFVDRLEERDLRAVMQIALIALVILPALPDETYGPYDVLNPREIWIVVVLITFISLGSYVAYRLVGARAGTLLGGVLGGLISSTATTASYARRTRGTPAHAATAAVVLMIASTVVFARIFVELGAVASFVVPQIAAPLAAMALGSVALCAVGFWLHRPQRMQLADEENPAELGAALVFGLLYGIVLLAVAAAKQHFGTTGLYTVAAISGLTDVDAITISTAKLVAGGRVDPGTGWRTILIAALANLVFKGALAGVLGGTALLRRLAPLFGAAIALGAAILAFWP